MSVPLGREEHTMLTVGADRRAALFDAASARENTATSVRSDLSL